MNRTYLSVTLLALSVVTGCSGDPSAPDYATQGFHGEVKLATCDMNHEPALVRCGGDAVPGIIAAVCGDLEADNTVTVTGGDFAVSGQSHLAAPLHVTGGSFTGLLGIQADNTEDVSGDLATSGDWVVSSPAHVGGDAFIGGKLEATNSVAVDGVLHVANADTQHVTAGTIKADGTTVMTSLKCELAPAPNATIQRVEAGDFLDLGQALTAHSVAAEVTLDCARYRFTSFGIDNDLVLHVSGHTVIVVDGDVRVAAPMTVKLDPDATLDFLIGGSLEVDNTLSFSGGSTWLAIGNDLKIAAPLTLVGFLYAPQSAVAASEVSADNILGVSGSLLVNSVHVASPITVTAVSGPALPACAADERQ
jgi:hypothetical protein